MFLNSDKSTSFKSFIQQLTQRETTSDPIEEAEVLETVANNAQVTDPNGCPKHPHGNHTWAECRQNPENKASDSDKQSTGNSSNKNCAYCAKHHPKIANTHITKECRKKKSNDKDTNSAKNFKAQLKAQGEHQKKMEKTMANIAKSFEKLTGPAAADE
mmetsp:Transcript_19858/g.33236  ORF Transcript_19858/g.33236 Transcript_19858/m.33236 type:complete len:158 (-) Transcript_19858:658-1131(-)